MADKENLDQEVEVTTEAAEQATTEATQEATTEAAQESVQEPVQLQLADLQGLGRVVDLASRRGAFEASELQFVGTLYNKLNAFLAYVAETRKEGEAQESAQESTEAEAKE